MSQVHNLKFQTPIEWKGLRLDKALSFHPEIKTRSRAEKLIDAQLILINGKFEKSSFILKGTEEIQVQIPKVSATLEPLSLDLDIQYEDSDLLVINKPAGLVVHPAEGHAQDTLVNAILSHTKDLSMGFHELRPGIVHRLDKDTSGLLVVAKNNDAHHALAKQFALRTVHRMYWALVQGVPKIKTDRIETYLARHPNDRKRFASRKIGGKLAITNYTLEKSYQNECSLLYVKLETGRTHQIRVHLSERGHPIIGDTTYGAKKNLLPGRFALHAAELGFSHPSTGQFMKFSVGWPEDLKKMADQFDF